ncbi:MAG: ArsR/SmtB family transcription factor [Rhodospirillaceae bacterium]
MPVADDLSPLEKNTANTCSVLRSIGNPHRLSILCRLSHREHSVTELVSVGSIGQSALSQHLARLRRDGLVMTRREAQTIYYSLKGSKIQIILAALSKAMDQDTNTPG